MNWQGYLLPLSDAWMAGLRQAAAASAVKADETRPGRFFRGTFRLDKAADTFLDMTGYSKGGLEGRLGRGKPEGERDVPQGPERSPRRPR